MTRSLAIVKSLALPIDFHFFDGMIGKSSQQFLDEFRSPDLHRKKKLSHRQELRLKMIQRETIRLGPIQHCDQQCQPIVVHQPDTVNNAASQGARAHLSKDNQTR